MTATTRAGSICHPTLPSHGHGLCRTCYQQQYRTSESYLAIKDSAVGKSKRKAANALYRKRRGAVALLADRAWRAAHIDRVRQLRREHEYRKRHAFVESIIPVEIYERDRWICGLCKRRVKLADATLDHILPLSKGGLHKRQNVQLAHRRCNSGKCNYGVSQMRLMA